MEIAGYIASVLIGISMGLIGGGGSILTIPILVYLFGISPILAVSYSLFIVGSTSIVGAFTNFRRGLVSFRLTLIFGCSSTTTVFIIRKFIIPFLPINIFRIGSVTVTQSLLVMIVFALLMLVAAFSMIRNQHYQLEEKVKPRLFRLMIYGAIVGLITGFLGAGGGFLLIPALVILMKVSMKEAIGTSLAIIALNSLIGFVIDITNVAINWEFLLTVTSIAIGGTFIGIFINKKINEQKLKRAFGWFVLIMGIYIIVKEVFF